MNFASNKIAPSKQKLRGGYYTPVSLAKYLCEWVLSGNCKRILEPSAGDGNFLSALHEESEAKGLADALEITAVEIDSLEIDKARGRLADSKSQIDWINEDFFQAYGNLRPTYDAVIGNPPFIRFQNFDENSRDTAFSHLRSAGYRPTKLANAWAGFMQLSIELLSEGGRLAMVVPAELLQVKYAEELRERITQMFDHVVLVTFRRLVFDGIQQEVVLVLAEGKRAEPGEHSIVHTVELEGADELFCETSLSEVIAHAPEKHARDDVKWTALFLPDESFSTLESAYKSNSLSRLGELADVDVGIVTGRNSFFVVDAGTAAELDLGEAAVPLVGRTSSLSSIVFSPEDFAAHEEKHPSVLIDLNGINEDQFSAALKKYIKQGERQGVHQGYKCRIRKRWFDVPSIYAPDAFLFRQIYDAPLLVANEVSAAATDTIHRVRFKSRLSGKRLAASFCNSLTFAWAEVCGRSYGGGVLELEPREAEELPIPYEAASQINYSKLDKILRQGGIESALDYTDPILLQGGLGLSERDVSSIRESWRQLRDRRKNRKHVPKSHKLAAE